jgi:hypothetical protein
MQKKPPCAALLCTVFYAFCPSPNLEISPPSSNQDSERIRYFKQDTSLYILESLGYALPSFDEEKGALYSLGCLDELSPSLQKAILETQSPLDRIDSFQLRNRFGLAYLETQELRHPDFVLPQNVEDFIKATHFQSWTGEVIPESRVKGKTRALYHSPASYPYEISVAVTHDSIIGDIRSAVRETEVMIRNRKNSKNWNFYAYDHRGQLQAHSEFRRGLAPSPAACMSCHYDPSDRSFSPLHRNLETLKSKE